MGELLKDWVPDITEKEAVGLTDNLNKVIRDRKIIKKAAMKTDFHKPKRAVTYRQLKQIVDITVFSVLGFGYISDVSLSHQKIIIHIKPHHRLKYQFMMKIRHLK